MSGSEEAAAAVPVPEGPVPAAGEPTATPAEPPPAEGAEVAPPAAAAAAAAVREGEAADESKTDVPEVAAAAEQAAAESRGSATGSPDEFQANMSLEDRLRREPAQKVNGIEMSFSLLVGKLVLYNHKGLLTEPGDRVVDLFSVLGSGGGGEACSAQQGRSTREQDLSQRRL